jgi:hypothetical protein
MENLCISSPDKSADISIASRAGPPYTQVKHLLEAPKKLKKLTAKKCPKFKKRNTHRPQFKEISE